ncbi:unnamed protein product [Brassicogethes aeneus]|uniref:Uncharacterized protein n=1 Tax=Brassicogethes aeneus TaxID=1431903 RepID=A0A9P0B9S1_BRAAE|nr:unnamed protein product [Brassicogethes aeneus]
MEEEFSLLLSEISTNDLLETGDGKFVNSSTCPTSSDNNSITTSISEVFPENDQVTTLKRKLKLCQEKCHKYEEENKKLSDELFQERLRSGKMRSKLEFVKDNQDVFMRLKEAYINMRYNESAGRKMVQVREKGLQTYEGILCRACVSTEQTRKYLNSALELYKDAKILTKDDFDKISAAVNFIRSMVQNREKEWSTNFKRESMYRNQIVALTKANEVLKRHDASSVNLDGMKKEIQILKKIVIKMEQRHRQPNINNTGDELNNVYCLDQSEKDVVDELVSRFDQRVREKKKTKRRARSKHGHVKFESSDVETTLDLTISLNGTIPEEFTPIN